MTTKLVWRVTYAYKETDLEDRLNTLQEQGWTVQSVLLRGIRFIIVANRRKRVRG